MTLFPIFAATNNAAQIPLYIWLCEHALIWVINSYKWNCLYLSMYLSAAPQHMALLGQGSDPGRSPDPSCSCSRADPQPTLPGGGSNQHPCAPKTPAIPLYHSRNSGFVTSRKSLGHDHWAVLHEVECSDLKQQHSCMFPNALLRKVGVLLWTPT